MWTNVFRIVSFSLLASPFVAALPSEGGLHQLSWFQLLPNDSDLTLLDKSAREELRDAATLSGSVVSKFRAHALIVFANEDDHDKHEPTKVIYVVCPFPEHSAVLKTLIESSIAVGSVLFSADSDRRSALYNQVSKALSCSVGVDEASSSNIVALSGFSIPRFVLQIVTADTIFRVTNPPFGELIILKEIAFTDYDKARRVSQGSS
ncbi:Mediator of RNA polymerase II transcription subunit 13-like protein, partial [Drosera capensis]